MGGGHLCRLPLSGAKARMLCCLSRGAEAPFFHDASAAERLLTAPLGFAFAGQPRRLSPHGLTGN